MVLLLAFYLLDVDSDIDISQQRGIPSLNRGAVVAKRPWHLSYCLRSTYFTRA
jgi:hypothetical protein